MMANSKKNDPGKTPKPSRPEMPGYGLMPAADGADLLPWSWLLERVKTARNYWVITVGPGSKPHAVPVWGLWAEGAFFFGSGLDSRKGRNLVHNPNVVVHLESGDEVVILEGTARLESNEAVIVGLDGAYQQKYGVALKGNPVFRMEPAKAFGWLEADFPRTATRWQLVNGS